MPFIPTNNTTMIEVRMTSLGELVENTLYFDIQQEQTETNVRFITRHVGDWWNTYIKPLQRDTAIMRYVYGTNIEYEDGYTYSDTRYANAVGGVTGGESLPNNVTMCMSLRTESRGRSRRGRNFVIGLGTTHVTGDVVDLTVRNNWLAAYQALLPGGGADPTPYRWCVVSRYSDGKLRTSGLKTYVASVVLTTVYVATMRKRLPR